MNYRETIFLIGKCLTLQAHPDHIPEIRKLIRSGRISWERLVWASTSELVLPALYFNLLSNELTDELPEDLYKHLEHLYQLNLQKNQAILTQSQDLIQLLNKHGIHPIFLKGVGNLFDNLYLDIGERMISDIDILLPNESVIEAAEIFKGDGYKSNKKDETLHWGGRHYPNLVKDGEPSRIEIHYRPVNKPYDKNFGFYQININKKRLNLQGEAYVLSDDHQIILNMMNVLMNDGAYLSGKMSLRHIYDLFLLSTRKDLLETIHGFGYYLNRFNAYLAFSSKLLGTPPSMPYQENLHSRIYFQRFFSGYNQSSKRKLNWGYLFFIGSRLIRDFSLIIKSIYRKDVRRRMFKQLNKPKRFKRYFIRYKNVAAWM